MRIKGIIPCLAQIKKSLYLPGIIGREYSGFDEFFIEESIPFLSQVNTFPGDVYIKREFLLFVPSGFIKNYIGRKIIVPVNKLDCRIRYGITHVLIQLFNNYGKIIIRPGVVIASGTGTIKDNMTEVITQAFPESV